MGNSRNIWHVHNSRMERFPAIYNLARGRLHENRFGGKPSDSPRVPVGLFDRTRVETKSPILWYGHIIKVSSGVSLVTGADDAPLLIAGRRYNKLDVAEGAELKMEIGIFTYDFWGGKIAKEGPGRVTFRHHNLRAHSGVWVSEGSFCLLSKWIQGKDEDKPNTYHARAWSVEKRGWILGTGSVEFRHNTGIETWQENHPSLEIREKGIIEGGVDGEGVFTVSHLTLLDGAVIRVAFPKGKAGQGKIEAGQLLQSKPATVSVDLSNWSPSAAVEKRIPIASWGGIKGVAPRFELLPDWRAENPAWKLAQTETEVYLYHD